MGVTELQSVRPADAADRMHRVMMQPLYIGGCLGWLHAPIEGQTTATLGVVLCPALGREARWSYRSLRQLADRLANAGLPCLRFEYPGSGDSIDLQPGVDPLTAWRNSVHEAADSLRAHTGLDRVVLAGLRLGGLMAADIALTREDITAVALLGPVLSGRTYARELRLAAVGGPGEQQPEGGIELDGIVLPNTALAALGKIDLMRAAKAPARQVLIMDDNPRAIDYAEHCRKLGATATLLPFAGYDEMMRVATSSQVPHSAWADLTAWLGQLAPERAPMRHAVPLGHPVLRQADWAETPMCFGPDGRLVGVLCEPLGRPADSRAVLITNTGHDPRAGIAGFGTRTARRLAAEGIATFRFDFAGLGDSRLPGDADSHPYEIDREADIGAALDVLQDRGYQRFAAIGVCTGAYHLLHGAMAETRLDLLLLLNLVTFEWRRGDILEVAQRSLGRPTGRYKELAREPETWRRLLRGKVDMSHVATTLTRRAVARVCRAGVRILGHMGVQTRLDQPQRLVRGVLGRGVRLLLISGFDDPGVALLESNFGRAGRGLAAMPGAEVRIERDVDHTLSRRFMQDRMVDILLAKLKSDR